MKGRKSKREDRDERKDSKKAARRNEGEGKRRDRKIQKYTER